MLTTPGALTAFAAVGLLLAGCAGADTGATATDLAVTGTGELTFDPDVFEVPAGQEITLELTSEGVEHDFVIADAAGAAEAGDAGHGDHGGGEDHDDHGDGDDHADNNHGDGEDHADDDAAGDDHGADEADGDLHVAHAEMGQTSTTTFTVHAPGDYEVYCAVPGHRQAGMTATLTVTDAD